MAQYTYLQVKQLFMELFCTRRTGIADPTIRHVKRCTFLVDEGEYDGEAGYWVAEEETGDEGFVSPEVQAGQRKRPRWQTTEETWFSTEVTEQRQGLSSRRFSIPR